MLLVNFLIFIVASFVCGKIYNSYIRVAIINKHRFKFFEMRDRLTDQILSGNISVSDEEYKNLLKLLNTSINIFDDKFSFAGFFNYLVKLSSDKELNSNINKMITKLKKHENKVLAQIACEYFETIHVIYQKYTHRTPLSVFISLIGFAGKRISERKKLEAQIDADLESKMQSLRPICALA